MTTTINKVVHQGVSSIFIETREWTDKTYGNTYFSNRIWVDGRVAFIMPFEYGYGDHAEFRAFQELATRGFVSLDLANAPRWAIRDEMGVHIYTAKSQVAKRDMFKPFGNDMNGGN